MGKTILFDYSVGDPLLLPAERAASCFQMPRPSAGHDEEVRQGRQPGSAHASLSEVFAVTLGVTLGVSLGVVLLVSPAPHPSISSNQ